jgi:hypothetical protein
MRRTIAEHHARHRSVDIDWPSQGHTCSTEHRRQPLSDAVCWEPFCVERLDD